MDRLPEFITNHPLLVGAFVGLLSLLLWTSLRTLSRKGLTAAQSVQLLNREEGVPVDIRGEANYRAGHIINAVRLDPAQFEADVRKLEKYKDKPLLVYCESGVKSAGAVTRLRAAGFARVHELQGGLAAWRAENFPLETHR